MNAGKNRRIDVPGKSGRGSLAALLTTMILVSSTTTVAWALGDLTQKPGRNGCVSNRGARGACKNGRLLESAGDVVVSPNGTSVYVVGINGVSIFDRDPATGVLRQKPGIAGCISTKSARVACRRGRALQGASGVAVSPEGNSVYVASAGSNAVAIFNRDPATGALRQKHGKAGCISRSRRCQKGKALRSADGIAVSPDGRSVYVASGGPLEASPSDAVAIFDRNPATGALRQKRGRAGCVSETGTESLFSQRAGVCKNGTAFKGAVSVGVSPDGKNVYVASSESSAVAIFDRNPTSGALTQKPGPSGCIAESTRFADCTLGTAPELPGGVGDSLYDAHDIALSPDGKSVYAAGADAISIFDRDPATGTLSQKPIPTGCISAGRSAGGECLSGLGEGFTVAVSPDGMNVYVAPFTGMSIFDRDPTTGALMQEPGPPGCVSSDGTGGGCQSGRALANVKGIAISPDGKNVYAASFLSEAVAVFDR